MTVEASVYVRTIGEEVDPAVVLEKNNEESSMKI